MTNKIVVVVKGVILHEDKALIIKRSDKDEIDPGSWECAGGKIDFGEELENALMREVREEVGLNIFIEKLLYATTFMTNSARQVVILIYKCSANNDDVKLSEEHSEYLWVGENDFRELLNPAILADMDKYDVFDEIF